jgi:cytochrome c-type biogenesis protein CcmH/NrfG
MTARDPSEEARAALEYGRRAQTLPEALQAYEEAVRLDPGNPDAWNALGLGRLTAGDAAGAEQALRRALAIEPRHYGAQQNLEWALRGVR